MDKPSTPSPDSHGHHRHTGIIAFCETNLRYEKGFKAWIFLGPDLIGALGFEIVIDTGHAKGIAALGPWIGFLLYLVLFPSIWRSGLKLIRPKKVATALASPSSAIKRP